MGMRQLESAICAELREVTKNPRIRVKDICEWSTGDPQVDEKSEVLIHLPGMGINAVILKSLDKRGK